MRLTENVYFCVDKKGKIVSNPFWLKQDVIIFMEEIEYPELWKSLYKEGYRIQRRTIFRNPNWGIS